MKEEIKLGDLVELMTFPESLGLVYAHEESFPNNLCIRWLKEPSYGSEEEDKKLVWDFLKECSEKGELRQNLYKKKVN